MQIGWHRDDFVPWREEVFLFVLVCVTGDWARERFSRIVPPLSLGKGGRGDREESVQVVGQQVRG